MCIISKSHISIAFTGLMIVTVGNLQTLKKTNCDPLGNASNKF